jgi:hypothetical protein
VIEGLSILRKYEPDAEVYGVTRSTGSIELNETAFAGSSSTITLV